MDTQSPRPSVPSLDTEATTQRVVLSGLLALAVANGIGRFAFTPILPMMQEDAGLGVVHSGLLASANYAGYLLGALWATMHRVRVLHAVRTGFLVTAAATIAMGAADGIVVWTVLRLLAGIASAWLMIHASAWCLERLAPLRRPLLGGMVFSGVGVGIVAAGLACLALTYVGAGSRSAWVVLGTLALVVTACVWSVVGVDGGSPIGRSIGQARFRWTPDAARLVFCYGVFGLGYIIPGTYVPLMAKEVIQDPFIFGWAWPIFGLAAAASTVIAVLFAASRPHRAVWGGAAALMAVGVVSPLILAGMPGILMAALLVGGTFMVTTMAGLQEARRVAGDHAAVLIAAMTSAFAAGQIVGPLLVSFLVERTGNFAIALWIASGLLLASVVLLQGRVPNRTA